MSLTHPQSSLQPGANAAPEKYLIAFVIQGDDVFKITADNIIHTTGTANGPAFDAIAKLKAAAALLELTNRHKERPDELRQMARELAGEGMKLMARASSDIRPAPASAPAITVLESAPANVAETLAEPVRVETILAIDERPLPEPAKATLPVAAMGLAAVPRPEERSGEAEVLPGNSKIALISG